MDGWIDGWDGYFIYRKLRNDSLHYKPHSTIPPLQSSRREPRDAFHSPSHIPQLYYRLFSGHRHFSPILYHIILHLDFPLLMSSQVVCRRAQSSIIYQVHELYRLLMIIRVFGYWVFVQPSGTAPAPHSGGGAIEMGRFQTYSNTAVELRCPCVQ